MRLAWLVLSLASARAPAAADPFTDCEARFASRPDEYASSDCFFQVAKGSRRWVEAGRRLDALAARHPEILWLRLSGGNVAWTRDAARAERLYREAADGFARQGEAEGEVLARYNLRNLLYRRGRLEEAGREVERAVEVAERSGEPLALARALTLEGLHLTDTGRDLAAAYRSLRRAERAASAEAPYTLRRGVGVALGNVCFQLGRYEEALGYYRQVERIAAEQNDAPTLATTQYNVANTRLRQLEEWPRPGGREEIRALATRALATAVRADNDASRALLHRTLGELAGGPGGKPGEAEAHFRECIAVAQRSGQPRELAHCLWSLAQHEHETGRRAEARRHVAAALALAAKTGHSWSLAHASRQRLRVGFGAGPGDGGESLQALDAIEALRRLQEDEGAAGEVFSAWARDYYWLAGRLLERASSRPSRADLALAFAVTERMRSRALLDALGSARVGAPPPADHPLAGRRRGLLQEIVGVHRRLRDPVLDAGQRAKALADLERLELDEQEVRGRLRALVPRNPRFDLARLASLDEAEAGLAADEALLSFQVALWRDVHDAFSGGAWLTVSTRSGTRAYRIPDRLDLQPAVAVLLGLLERRDGLEAAAAAGLGRRLLGEALGELPASVRRLIVVPDDALHRVPWAALRLADDGEPLAARYDLSLAPSVTLWLRWRRATHLPGPALVFADPSVAGPGGEAPARERGWLAGGGRALGRLPFARREGRTVVRRVGHGSRLREGGEASERWLKQARLDGFSLLHFAAHAVVDEARPERSAVVLAPGGEAEDGLLQMNEVAGLGLEGRIVVLSACRSAGGAVRRGEGVLSLARAFFQAGAHAVVASLWPLRDDEAARLFEAFYRRLQQRSSVAAALSGAQRELRQEGLPAAAWAGLVVLGEGAIVPVSEAKRPRATFPVALGASAAGLLLVVILLTVLRRSRRNANDA